MVGAIRAEAGTDRELSKAIRQLELPIALVELDDFTVTAVSRATLKLLGMPPTAVVGRPVIDLIRSEDRAEARAEYEAMRRLALSTSTGLIVAWARPRHRRA